MSAAACSKAALAAAVAVFCLAQPLRATAGAPQARPVAVALPSPAQPILDAERAFAQAVTLNGIAPGFRQFAASDAVLFLPDPTPAAAALDHANWIGDLVWRPQFAGVAASGDMGFDVGPSLARAGGRASGGYYLTIWRKTADGGWKFVVDHGVDMPATIYAPLALPPTTLALGPPLAPRVQEAVREADAALNGAMVKAASKAYAARLDDQAIVVRANRPVAIGRRRALALAAGAPAVQEAYTLNGGVSGDGTFGYTYGRARWSTPAGAQLAYYVRVWRLTGQGWRLLVDHLAER